MKFIDNTWKEISERERLQLSKTEGQVSHLTFTVTVIFIIYVQAVLSISTDVRRRASATSIRDVGYFFPKLKYN